MKEIVARDKPFTKEVWSREQAKKTFRDMGENFKVELIDAIPARPADQDLQAGRLVRSLPRPAYDLDGQGRQRLQADEGGRRLLARRQQQPDAHPHLRHRLRQAGRARRLSQADRGSREARPPPRSAARWTCSISRKKRPARCSGIRKAGRCSRRWRTTSAAASSEFGFAEVNAPQLMDSSLWVASGHMATFRESHVPDAAARRRRARLRHQADELPRPHPDLQERAEVVPRPALQARRVRQGASLRAVRRAARADARARLHAGRRARLHHRGPDRGGVAQDQQPDPVDLRGFRLLRRAHQVLRPPGQAHRRRRGVGQGGSRADGGAEGIAAGRGRSTKAKAPSTGRSSNTCCATPSAATGNAAPCRSTSTCRAGSAPSTSTSIPTR